MVTSGLRGASCGAGRRGVAESRLAKSVLAFCALAAGLSPGALAPAGVDAAAGLQYEGADEDLEWVGGYHEPFNYDYFFDYMMNSCDGYTNADGDFVNVARPWMDVAQEPYVNYQYHPALDMNAAGDADDPVYAIADGTVKTKTSSGWPGEARWITHERGDGSTFTAVYGHINVNLPPDRDPDRPGHQVNRGDQIGTIYSYGMSQLHFGINTGDTTASGTISCSSWPEDGDPPLQGWADPLEWLADNPIGSVGGESELQTDIDGDGQDDLVVGAPGENSASGLVHVMFPRERENVGFVTSAVVVPVDELGNVNVAIEGAVGAGVQVRLQVLGFFAPLELDGGLVFVPVDPCVVFDSRSNQGASGGFAGLRVGGSTTTYDVVGSFDAAQGGGNAGCGVPVDAEAVELNLVGVNAVREGNLRVFATGTDASGGVLNFGALVPKMNNANAVVVSASGEVDVFMNDGPQGDGLLIAEIRGTVTGYWTRAA